MTYIVDFDICELHLENEKVFNDFHNLMHAFALYVLLGLIAI